MTRMVGSMFLGGVLVSSLAIAGCWQPDPAPRVVFVVSGRPVQSVPFGDLSALATRDVEVGIRNDGDARAVLGGVDGASLGLAAPFEIPGGTGLATRPVCREGQVLEPGEDCRLALRFAPRTVGNFRQEIAVRYADESDRVLGGSAGLELDGSARLDCGVAPALVQSRDEGAQAARERMAIERQEGTAAGAALTRENGVSDGYARAYDEAFGRGYDSPQGYAAGYDPAFGTGKAAGLGDESSCRRGADAGRASGEAAGVEAGRADGYRDGYAANRGAGEAQGDRDGYRDGLDEGREAGRDAGAYDGYRAGYDAGRSDAWNDGYSNGWYDGYDAGFADGDADCREGYGAQESWLAAEPAPAAVPGELIQACRDAGYGETYTRQAWQDAYDAARAANLAYQAGLAEGKAQGTTRGFADGLAAGVADGRDAGGRDGFAAGSAERFERCRDDAYPAGYQAGYAAGYVQGQGAGASDGYRDGYDRAYSAAWSEGRADGADQAYAPAYDAAARDGYAAGLSQGWSEGDAAGYSDGYDAGYDEGSWGC